jgi:hypothetical protein
MNVWERLRVNYYKDVDDPEVNVEGYIDEARGIRYLGKARKQPDGKYICLANVKGSLCLVEVTLTPR